ncbi:MAG: diacylglycerol kinase family lipid kinase [Fimbriimonadaceae bacterium]|nr:diacylglycerol kinase family lipid kinase [Chitinophagales bacterium]
MKKRILFIINPVAGVKRKDKIPRYINKYLDHNKFTYEVIYTESRGHATKIAKDNAKNNIDVVCVAGGDGSVNEAATGLIGSNTALAIIPSGSGNGLARHLGYSINIRSTLQIINEYHIKRIDVCKVNDHFFFSLIGIGFDAYAAKVFSKEETRGFLTYAWASIKSIASYQPFEYKMKINNETIDGTAFMINVCNSNQFGYNVKVAPYADIQDGIMDIVIIKKLPKIQIPILVLQLFMRTHLFSMYVKYIKTEKLSIESPAHAYLQIDGETVHKAKDFEITVQKGALSVLVNNDKFVYPVTLGN